jgi:catechol 2,3-dioxygenase-like lactoylglutathione lyase family enzyme
MGPDQDMQVLGIDHVQVAAPPGCEPEARRFYGELLGLRELPKPEALRGRGGAWFELASGQLHVGVARGFVPARKAHPALRLSEAGLDLLARRLLAAGEHVDWDHELVEGAGESAKADSLEGSLREPLGVRRFYTQDPWGNRLELLAYAAVSSGASRSPLPR